MQAEYKKITREDFDTFITSLEKQIIFSPPRERMKMFTGTEGAISVATQIIKMLSKKEVTREEALQYANIHFEHNGRGAYVI